MPPDSPAANKCPNCHTLVARGARHCPSCKLETSQMAAFAAAKLAAKRKGYGKVQIEGETSGPFYRKLLRPIVVVPVLVVVILAVFLARPAGPPAWTKLPATPTAVAKQLLEDISTGTDDGYNRAYALVSPSVKNPKDSDEDGKYRQLYHVLDQYLAAEFGSDWGQTMTLEPDKTNPQIVIAHIGVETLHVRTKEQTPAKLLNDTNHHYAVEGIDEFDVSEAAGLQKSAGIMAILNAEGGPGAGKNLQTIFGALGNGNRHETVMQRKLRILPNLRDPHNAVRQTVLQAWPIRKDAVIRHRLGEIVNDGRYPNDVRQTAQAVLQDNVPEEDLIAAGVNDTN